MAFIAQPNIKLLNLKAFIINVLRANKSLCLTKKNKTEKEKKPAQPSAHVYTRTHKHSLSLCVTQM